MAYDITDLNEIEIHITDGWREWLIPKFRIDMVVSEPFIHLYWTDTEKGSSGIRRGLTMDYQDVTFGYTSPSSAAEIESVIDGYIISAWYPSPPGVVDNAQYRLGMSSGLIEGGEVTINANPAKFDISAGYGVIVDDWTDPANPVIYEVTWAAQTAVTVTNLATSTFTRLLIDKTGAIVQQVIPITGEDRRDYIKIARLGHTNLTSIGSVSNYPDMYISPINQLRDLEEALGAINLGVKTTANGANLNINNTSGRIYLNGSYFQTNAKNPSFTPILSGTAITFRYRTQTGAGSSTALIDPTNYDVGGVITAVTGTRSTNQRIFLSTNGNFVIQYGQQQYNTFDLAKEASLTNSETFVLYGNIDEIFVLVAVLTLQSNCTDLTDTDRAFFNYASKFGEIGGAGGGAAGVQLVAADTTAYLTVDNSVPTLPIINAANKSRAAIDSFNYLNFI